MGNLEPDDIHDVLSKILFRMELLEKKRKTIKKLSLIFTFFSLGSILLFLFYSGELLSGIHTGKILADSLSSPNVSQRLLADKEILWKQILPVVQKSFIRNFLEDRNFLDLCARELSALITSADGTISAEFEVRYRELTLHQKEALYKALPELQNDQKVNRAIDNLIAVGGPRLYSSFLLHFEEHCKSLKNIYDQVQILKDDSLSKMPSLEKAVLGVTLEVFGKYLRKEGEKGGAHHE